MIVEVAVRCLSCAVAGVVAVCCFDFSFGGTLGSMKGP